MSESSAIPGSREKSKIPPTGEDGGSMRGAQGDRSAGEREKEVQDWLREVGLSVEDAKRVIKRRPQILNVRLEKEGQDMLNYLQTEPLWMNERETARVLRFAPQILSKSRTAFRSRLSFLKERACIAPHVLGQAVSKAPHVLWMNLENAEEVVSYILQCCPDLAGEKVGDILRRVPQILLAKPRELRTRTDFLKNKFGVQNPAALQKIISLAPRVLVYDIDNTLQKRLSYFKRDLGLPVTTIARVVTATPTVFDSSVQHDLRPVISEVQAALGLQHDEIKDILYKAPGLFEVSGVSDRWTWLRETVGLTEKQVTDVVRAVPAVLTYSVKSNLQQKWDFICGTMGGSKQDIIAAPVETLAASLQQRAMPRHAFLTSRGITGVSVADVLRGSDTEFCQEVAKCNPSEYRTYVDSDRFLLFYSQLV